MLTTTSHRTIKLCLHNYSKYSASKLIYKLSGGVLLKCVWLSCSLACVTYWQCQHVNTDSKIVAKTKKIRWKLQQASIILRDLGCNLIMSHACWNNHNLLQCIIISFAASWLFAASVTTFPMIMFCYSEDQTCDFTITWHAYSLYVMYMCSSIQLQLNAACFVERWKQYIFPKMSKDICSAAKARNKNWSSESTIRPWDNEDAPSVYECVRWQAAHGGWKLILT